MTGNGVRGLVPVLIGVAALGVVLGGARPEGQTYSRGQTASPAFEGWEQNEDGTFNFVFGYMNRNWDEELIVPIGPDTYFSPRDFGEVKVVRDDAGRATRLDWKVGADTWPAPRVAELAELSGDLAISSLPSASDTVDDWRRSSRMLATPPAT